jgi:hypothetical protein
MDLAKQHAGTVTAVLNAVNAYAEWAPVTDLAKYGLIHGYVYRSIWLPSLLWDCLTCLISYFVHFADVDPCFLTVIFASMLASFLK